MVLGQEAGSIVRFTSSFFSEALMVFYLLVAYLTACYLWALYVVLRLYNGRRLGVAAQIGRRDRTVRPLRMPGDADDYSERTDAVAVVGPASDALPKSNAA